MTTCCYWQSSNWKIDNTKRMIHMSEWEWKMCSSQTQLIDLWNSSRFFSFAHWKWHFRRCNFILLELPVCHFYANFSENHILFSFIHMLAWKIDNLYVAICITVDWQCSYMMISCWKWDYIAVAVVAVRWFFCVNVNNELFQCTRLSILIFSSICTQ